jgi:hypothetical protein
MTAADVHTRQLTRPDQLVYRPPRHLQARGNLWQSEQLRTRHEIDPSVTDALARNPPSEEAGEATQRDHLTLPSLVVELVV